jgi:hypothetical protein
MSDWTSPNHPVLREAIQNTLQANKPDPRLMQDGLSRA